MKNKFKLFCTFMICLIFLTLVNTNSPQPSADTTAINDGVIMSTGAFVDCYPDAYNFNSNNENTNSVTFNFSCRTYTDCTLKYIVISQRVNGYYEDDGTGRTDGFAEP